MEFTKVLSVSELNANLRLDNDSVGNLIGISDQKRKSWQLVIYLGLFYFQSMKRRSNSKKLLNEVLQS